MVSPDERVTDNPLIENMACTPMHSRTSYAAVTLEVDGSEVVADEGDGFVRVCARMLGQADYLIHAVFTASDDSAVFPHDYGRVARVIEFPAFDDSPQCAEFPIVDDNVVEYSETFSVMLSVSEPDPSMGRVVVGDNNTAVVTIIDNDCKSKYNTRSTCKNDHLFLPPPP